MVIIITTLIKLISKLEAKFIEIIIKQEDINFSMKISFKPNFILVHF